MQDYLIIENKKIKVCLVTIWHVRNYGAEIQAYATIRALQELGYIVEMINIRLSDIKKKSFGGYLGSFLYRFSPAEKKFNVFWEKYIPSTCRYRTLKELKNNPPKADYYIVGSDQVWNPEIVKCLLPAFLLDFGNDKVKRIAYASSFGKNIWDFSQELTMFVQKQLDRFVAIACREQTGCKILKNIFGIDSINVVDPTLLYSEYKELIGMPKEKQTLVFYPLNITDYELKTFSQKLAHKLNLQWVNANKQKRILMDKIIWDRNSIEQWISDIATSQLVITRSFHGLLISLIYHRQFIIVNNSDRSSRLTDLLIQLGLMNRFFSSIDEVEKSHIWERKINYVEIDRKIQAMRSVSWNFLKEVVK